MAHLGILLRPDSDDGRAIPYFGSCVGRVRAHSGGFHHACIGWGGAQVQILDGLGHPHRPFQAYIHVLAGLGHTYGFFLIQVLADSSTLRLMFWPKVICKMS